MHVAGATRGTLRAEMRARRAAGLKDAEIGEVSGFRGFAAAKAGNVFAMAFGDEPAEIGLIRSDGDAFNLGSRALWATGCHRLGTSMKRPVHESANRADPGTPEEVKFTVQV